MRASAVDWSFALRLSLDVWSEHMMGCLVTGRGTETFYYCLGRPVALRNKMNTIFLIEVTSRPVAQLGHYYSEGVLR